MRKDGVIGIFIVAATIALLALSIYCVAFGQSQTPLPSPTSTLAPAQQATPASTPQEQAEATPRPLYGYQGVLVETLNGKNVASQSVDQLFNPASTVKLATALIALQTLGPDHRFSTGVWTDGV